VFRFEWVDARLLLDFIVSLKKDFTQKDLYLKVNDETSLLLFDKFVKTLLDSEGEKIITQIISIESEPSLIAEICPKYGGKDDIFVTLKLNFVSSIGKNNLQIFYVWKLQTRICMQIFTFEIALNITFEVYQYKETCMPCIITKKLKLVWCFEVTLHNQFWK
jgi:hypothetical protein